MNPSPADNHPATAPAPIPAPQRSVRTTSRPFRLYPPIITAAVILLLSVLFFTCWGLFCNKSIRGTWTLHFLLNEKDCAVSYSFEEDGTCYFHNGGTIRKGTYQIAEDKSENGSLLTMTFHNFNDFGTAPVTHEFRYTVDGSSFGSRKMKCTDCSGMIFEPDILERENEEDVKRKKAAADFIETDGHRYYVFTMHEDKGYETPLRPMDVSAADQSLLGIWLERNDDPDYENTFAFREDNTIQITYRDRIYKGCYVAYNGECIFNIAQVDGTFSNILMQYAVKDDTLTLTINDVPAEYSRTDAVNAFESDER